MRRAKAAQTAVAQERHLSRALSGRIHRLHGVEFHFISCELCGIIDLAVAGASFHIAFEGPIAAGKTTWTHILSQRINAKTLLEAFAENEFLADFYADRKRWALPMQLWFLSERHRQLASTDFAGSWVADLRLPERGGLLQDGARRSRASAVRGAEVRPQHDRANSRRSRLYRCTHRRVVAAYSRSWPLLRDSHRRRIP